MNSTLLPTCRWVNLAWITLAINFILTGCEGLESLGDIDKTIAQVDLMWTKKGVNNRLPLRECTMKSLEVLEAKKWDVHDTCMLQKGFTFNPKPKGYANICLYSSFKTGIACQSYRDKIKIMPDP